MFVRGIVGVMLCAVLAGCTHTQLTRSTVLATGTIMDIHYQTVLNNLALLSCHPEAIPSHIDLEDGVVQVSDEAALGTSGGFTTTSGRFDIDQFGPSGGRNVSEQWGTNAITDPHQLAALQDLYRVALGMTPLPPTNTVVYLRAKAQRRAGTSERATADNLSDSQSEDGNATTSADGSAAGESDNYVPIDVLLSDVPPPGWFHLGCKQDVPKNACYVGRYGDRYAWVTADGMPELSRFTVVVLGAIKLDPGPNLRPRGLIFTR